MKKIFAYSLFLVSAVLVIPSLNAQEISDQYNPNSVEPIAKYEHLYKVRVWRIIDLSEKQNKGFFARGGEIGKLIIEAVKSGEISEVYMSDSLTTLMPKEMVFDRLQARAAQVMDIWSPTENVYEGDYRTHNGKNYVAIVDSRGQDPELTEGDYWQLTTVGKAQDFAPNQIKILEVVEDIIFDKRRSRLYYDVQAIRPIVPGSENFERGNIDVQLGWYKYKDLVQVFRNHPDEAIWFNRNNTAENKNFEDAFKLRLFKGSIYKVENPEDDDLNAQYGTLNNRPYIEAIMAREWAEMKLMEREHNLWEF